MVWEVALALRSGHGNKVNVSQETRLCSQGRHPQQRPWTLLLTSTPFVLQGRLLLETTAASTSKASPPHLTDATAAALEGILLFVLVILLNLLREEGVKDLVDQLGGGGFCGPFVLLLRRVSEVVASLRSPGRDAPSLEIQTQRLPSLGSSHPSDSCSTLTSVPG